MTDRLAIEANGTRLDEQRFPGRQGRILFAYLAVQHGRSVPRDELAELLWGEDLPATWEKALRVLTTKLRALLEECGIDGSSMLRSAFGCYQLTLPAREALLVQPRAVRLDGETVRHRDSNAQPACLLPTLPSRALAAR
jgi:DNA-binding SARP family transcriptional activator